FRQPEECSVLPNRSADRTFIGVLCLRAADLVTEIICPGICLPVCLTGCTQQVAMQSIASALQQRVEIATTRAPHLRVVGIGLDLHLLDGVHRRNDDITVGEVGDWYTVYHVITTTDRSTTNRYTL